MQIEITKDFSGIVFGFDLNFQGKQLIIAFIFWAITFKIN